MARTKQTARKAIPRASSPSWGGGTAQAQTGPVDATPSGKNCEYIRVDEVYDEEEDRWVFKESTRAAAPGKEDKYRDYAFTVNRRFESGKSNTWTLTLDIRSNMIKKGLQEVIGNVQGTAWHSPISRLDPLLILTFLPKIRAYIDDLKAAESRTEEEDDIIKFVSLLIEFVESEYSNTLDQVTTLLSHSEITFQYLWAIFIPRSILYTRCPTTSEPRAVRLVWAQQLTAHGNTYFNLQCQYVEASGRSPEMRRTTPKFGPADFNVKIDYFNGAVAVHKLPAYPFRFLANPKEMEEKLIARGKRWRELGNKHHMYYSGLAWQRRQRLLGIHVTGRLMIDKETFLRINANYPATRVNTDWAYDDDYYDNDEMPGNDQQKKLVDDDTLTDEELLLASPILFGFSFTDKVWLEFNIENIRDIQWNDEAFKNLVLPHSHKGLIRALVESYTARNENPDAPEFDDFIEGKGKGLIFNAFGPPGTGKTMSAEAISEHVRNPLYVVGAGDLGANPESLDLRLTEIFDIAHAWGAVVLIDEADVFLEERSVHNLSRNALVAVFLRQLEYYRGILFLTTNRVKVFDQAFSSRIHIALRYKDLDEPAKDVIWRAFLHKVGIKDEEFGEEEWKVLARKKLNGRQIKNAVRTAQALAVQRKVKLGMPVLLEVLEVMEAFEAELKAPDGMPPSSAHSAQIYG